MKKPFYLQICVMRMKVRWSVAQRLNDKESSRKSRPNIRAQETRAQGRSPAFRKGYWDYEKTSG